jgi:hypothetical protein
VPPPAKLLEFLSIEGELSAEKAAALKQALLQFATSRVADLFQKAKPYVQPQPAPASASSSSSAPAVASNPPAVASYLRSVYDLLRELEVQKQVAPKPQALDLTPFKEHAEVTLKGCNLLFADLVAMSQECKAMKKLTLENVTVNSLQVYDKAMIQLLLDGVEVVGASCAEENRRTKELFESVDSLGLTKEQLWNFVLELHAKAHEEFPVLHIAESMNGHADAKMAAFVTSSATFAKEFLANLKRDLSVEAKKAVDAV